MLLNSGHTPAMADLCSTYVPLIDIPSPFELTFGLAGRNWYIYINKRPRKDHYMDMTNSILCTLNLF